MKKTLLSLLLVFSCTPLIGSQTAEQPTQEKINKPAGPSWLENLPYLMGASIGLSIIGNTLEGRKCFKPVVTCTVFGGLFAIGRQLRYQSPFDMKEVCMAMAIGTGIGLSGSYLWQALKTPSNKRPVTANNRNYPFAQ